MRPTSSGGPSWAMMSVSKSSTPSKPASAIAESLSRSVPPRDTVAMPFRITRAP